MPSHFHNQDTDPQLKDKKRLSLFLDQMVHEHLSGIKKISLHYIFCTDAYLLTINQQFLDHDTFTDIITFDLSEQEHEVIGEVYISVDRIAENCLKFKTTFEQELHRVIFHGALHLCGFKDKKPADKKEMTKQENACLAAYLQ